MTTTNIRYCSRAGCFRPARPEDTLCGPHRAGRSRSHDALMARGSQISTPTIAKAFRAAALSEVLRRVSDLEANPIREAALPEWRAFHNWNELRRWLEDQIVDRPAGT